MSEQVKAKRSLTSEQKDKMKKAAREKRESARRELEKALAGKSEEEKKLYMLQLTQESLKKKLAKTKKKEERLTAPERKDRNRMLTALGIALVSHIKDMANPIAVIEQLKKVADAIKTDNKRGERLKADINSGIGVMEAAITTQDFARVPSPVKHDSASIQDGKKIYLSVPFEVNEKVKGLGAKFEPESKKWYIVDGVDDQAKFSEWLLAE